MAITLNGTTGITTPDNITHEGDTNTAIRFPAADTVTVETGGAERLRITSAGLVGIDNTAPDGNLTVGNTSVSGDVSIRIKGDATSRGFLMFGDAGGAQLGDIMYDHSDNHMRFRVNNSESMRIDPSGDLLVGKTASTLNTQGAELQSGGRIFSTTTDDGCFFANRLGSDGVLISLRQAGTQEGNIAVSGTTVSYNGGHLSRWAQLPDNSRPDLLKGTVMSNLDQMSNWDGEENEQLNCVQVSTVEGDPDVAGVFVAWDSTDDDYNDILLAMTGDMVIRIGAGVTVQRGDLLMSAGDGTAKPQGDDIVRSKTIAKVTSTHVSHTYEDGSYAVPCVLMAC